MTTKSGAKEVTKNDASSKMEDINHETGTTVDYRREMSLFSDVAIHTKDSGQAASSAFKLL